MSGCKCVCVCELEMVAMVCVTVVCVGMCWGCMASCWCVPPNVEPQLHGVLFVCEYVLAHDVCSCVCVCVHLLVCVSVFVCG